MTDHIVGSLPPSPQAQAAQAAMHQANLEAGVAATTPVVGPMWTHHGAAFPLAPVFDARAIIYVQRGNLHEALRIVLADPDRDVDRILDAGPLLIEDLERLVQHWTETTQGLTPGESSA